MLYAPIWPKVGAVQFSVIVRGDAPSDAVRFVGGRVTELAVVRLSSGTPPPFPNCCPPPFPNCCPPPFPNCCPPPAPNCCPPPFPNCCPPPTRPDADELPVAPMCPQCISAQSSWPGKDSLRFSSKLRSW